MVADAEGVVVDTWVGAFEGEGAGVGLAAMVGAGDADGYAEKVFVCELL